MEKQKVEFYVKCFTAKKSGNRTIALVANLGYTEKLLNFNQQDIAEVLGIPVINLAKMNIGDKIKVE